MRQDPEPYALALQSVWFPFAKEVFENPLSDVVSSLPPELSDLGSAFVSNLGAALSVAQLPYLMALSGVNQRRFQALITTQRIRARMQDNLETDEEREHWSMQTAEEKFNNEDFKGNITQPLPASAGAVLDDLTNLLADEHFCRSTHELLRQCTVLCWGAFEVVASDLFVVFVNERPSAVAQLLEDQRTRKLYDPREFGDALQDRNYDLTHCMGEVLIEQSRIDDVDTIRKVFDVLFPQDESLRSKLSDGLLWRLGQDRNLILHRRAVVDKTYKANTGSTLTVGSVLDITPENFEKYLLYVRDAGCALLRAASDPARAKT